jgi:pilus assembly protein CpaF
LPPISGDAPIISIRILHNKNFSLSDLKERKMITSAQKILLEKIIETKKNIFISGATGSGKTTLLTAMLNSVPPSDRIITIEDSFEINSNHFHCIGLQTKPMNSEGKGEYTLEQLVKQSLRMRPDRIVLGECRGAEIKEVLMAMNTGHSGSMATIHANSSNDVMPRIQALASLTNLDVSAVETMAKSAIDYIIHISNTGANGNYKRRIESIEKFS